jgi:hypothetical protein
MFKRKTVFILGAGASCHYGYPTGEGLVKKVIDRSEYAAGFFDRNRYQYHMPKFVSVKVKDSTDHFNVAYDQAIAQCKELASKLRQLNPLVIDFFLGHNRDLEEVGKFVVAWVLLESDWQFKNPSGSSAFPQLGDWYRFILHRMTFDLTVSHDLFMNNVHFVTFNYDLSLDKRLAESLAAIQLIKGEHAQRFLEGKVLHIYGSLQTEHAVDVRHFREANDVSFSDPTDVNYQKAREALDYAYEASKRIRVMHPEDKKMEDQTIDSAR